MYGSGARTVEASSGSVWLRTRKRRWKLRSRPEDVAFERFIEDESEGLLYEYYVEKEGLDEDEVDEFDSLRIGEQDDVGRGNLFFRTYHGLYESSHMTEFRSPARPFIIFG